MVETAKELDDTAEGSISPSVLFERCQDSVMELQNRQSDCYGMKTTFVSLYFGERHAQFTHVGDSRGYIFENGKCKFITEDHSVPMMLAKVGRIEFNDIPHHPDRNKLLRVMGIEWEESKEIIDDFSILDKCKQYAFLLCSDGFWEWITPTEIEKCLETASSTEVWIKNIEKILIRNGKDDSMDNYSAIGIIL